VRPCGFICAENTIKTTLTAEITNVHSFFYVKYLSFVSDFNDSWIFWMDFRRMVKYQISSKSVQWELSCSTRMDGQTDVTKLGDLFLWFGECAYKRISHLHHFRSLKIPSGCVYVSIPIAVCEKRWVCIVILLNVSY